LTPSSISRANDAPSLPPLDFDSNQATTSSVATSASINYKILVSGPPPPASWIRRENLQNHDIIDPEDPDWKRTALTPFFNIDDNLYNTKPRIPPLRELCMLVLLEDDTLPPDLIPYLSNDMKKQLCRCAAIQRPFTVEELIHTCDPAQGGTDGEIIIVGPTVRLSSILSTINPKVDPSGDDTVMDWDTESPWDALDATPYQSLALINTPLSPGCITSLPSTLTRLALLHLPATPSPPIWRLPSCLPLLTFIDLSFNKWLRPSKSFDKVVWSSWTKLTWLGLRGCSFDTPQDKSEALEKIGPRFRRHGTVVFDLEVTTVGMLHEL
jgi:hypothetical protein